MCILTHAACSKVQDKEPAVQSFCFNPDVPCMSGVLVLWTSLSNLKNMHGIQQLMHRLVHLLASDVNFKCTYELEPCWTRLQLLTCQQCHDVIKCMFDGIDLVHFIVQVEGWVREATVLLQTFFCLLGDQIFMTGDGAFSEFDHCSVLLSADALWPWSGAIEVLLSTCCKS